MEGFILGTKKEFFLNTDKKNITNEIAIRFIKEIGKTNGCPVEFIERCIKDAATVKDTKRRIQKAEIELRTTSTGVKYYSIKGKGFMETIPEDRFDDLYIFM